MKKIDFIGHIFALWIILAMSIYILHASILEYIPSQYILPCLLLSIVGIGISIEQMWTLFFEKENNAEDIAKFMHESYEEHARFVGWKKQEASRKAWEDIPFENRATMILTADDVLQAFRKGKFK